MEKEQTSELDEECNEDEETAIFKLEDEYSSLEEDISTLDEEDISALDEEDTPTLDEEDIPALDEEDIPAPAEEDAPALEEESAAPALDEETISELDETGALSPPSSPEQENIKAEASAMLAANANLKLLFILLFSCAYVATGLPLQFAF